MSLIAFLGNNLIKIIEGIRYSGKTKMLLRLEEFLHANDIGFASVIYIDGDRYNAKQEDLFTYVVRNLRPLTKTYLLLDELGNLEYESLFNELLTLKNLEIIVCSSTILKLPNLAGKYIKINTYSQSYRFQYPSGDTQKNYQDYLSCFEDKDRIEGMLYTILCRDALGKNSKISYEMLYFSLKLLVGFFGQIFAWKKVMNTMQKSFPKLTKRMVTCCLETLEDAHMIYPVKRYDIIKREELNAVCGYYFGNHGLIYSLNRDVHPMLVSRNIVFLELKRRKYTVYGANLNEVKYDFVAYWDNKWIIIKIIEKLYSRLEISQLRGIKGDYKRYLLVINSTNLPEVNDIKILTIANFLLKEDFSN